MENGIPKFRCNNVPVPLLKDRNIQEEFEATSYPEEQKHQLHHNENLQILIFCLLAIPLITYW